MSVGKMIKSGQLLLPAHTGDPVSYSIAMVANGSVNASQPFVGTMNAADEYWYTSRASGEVNNPLGSFPSLKGFDYIFLNCFNLTNVSITLRFAWTLDEYPGLARQNIFIADEMGYDEAAAAAETSAIVAGNNARSYPDTIRRYQGSIAEYGPITPNGGRSFPPKRVRGSTLWIGVQPLAALPAPADDHAVIFQFAPANIGPARTGG